MEFTINTRFYDRIINKATVRKIENITLKVAIGLLFINLVLIFFSKTFSGVEVLQNFNKPYLSAIAAPFTIILLFEVMSLIVALPKSISKSIAIQYEIISLVFLRRIFKDLSELENLSDFVNQNQIFLDLSIDIIGSLTLFFLIAIYYLIINSQKNTQKVSALIINVKKISSLVLISVFVILGFYYFGLWSKELAISGNIAINGYLDRFLEQFFIIMIFIDIIVVVISFIYKETYRAIFRDSALLVSVILIRLSFTLEHPYDIGVAIFAILIGIMTVAIYSFYKKYAVSIDS
jgi:hypothetical protein